MVCLICSLLGSTGLSGCIEIILRLQISKDTVSIIDASHHAYLHGSYSRGHPEAPG